ncbi:FecR family protein [Novosphingobium sp. FKTRR1]|uniref:FecR family protein n=1 Tax=Novosphingobium sp. FKTRR1 TaxID=2879118 RepID=UPI001CF03D1E|nr:FecR domain-containing protein [Novosphingobium sp. FKTRR1]
MSGTPPDDALEAARFVARMDTGIWSDADEAELRAWLSKAPHRHGLLLTTHAAWLLADETAPQAQADNADVTEPVAPGAVRLPRRAVLGGLAAATAGVIGSVLWYDRSIAYATKLGEIRRVPLVDGSVMTINSGSEIKVRIAKRVREVEITQGEAWFEVAKDASRPFVVAAGKAKAKAIGTAFSVRKRDSGVEVLVTEGVVETWSDDADAPRLRVTAGQRAFMGEQSIVRYEATRTSSVDRALAWREGMIDLNGTTLGDAAEEFNRYNDRKIVISDPSMVGEQFDGLFRIGDPEGFALAVRGSLNANVNMDDPRWIRIERAP